MKKSLPLCFGILLASVMIGCTNQKNSDSQTHGHTHEDGTTHSHTHEIDYTGAYALEDAAYGTKTIVTLTDDKRIIVTNALPNHETGAFPNEGNPNTIKAQELRYEIPLRPVYTGKAKWAREPGVALNGVKFEPETAERVVCESGEQYRIEARQNFLDMGLDVNNAHVQPTGAYHYHGVPTGMISSFDTGKDLVHVGYAKDGFPIYYSKSGTYKPSYQKAEEPREGTDCYYRSPRVTIDADLDGTEPDGTYVSDWEYVEGLGQLDECNGIEIDGNYAYLLTDEYPYVGRCLMGEFTEARPGGGRRPGADHPHGPPPGGARPPRRE